MSDRSYYPPRGGTMNFAFSDVMLAIIAACLIIIVLAGTNAV